ncbi:hypothetical protein LTR56_026957 [Elasticomyces elasticus]|nr:hypothetical protein LTR22_027889 [Elasticomyces elasticus]KAK3614867.1 hypothetical protein LTR56_026957 [Elasticomyces elasticus]KAK4903037.1 hypothetical protein LTR49_026912 [Elasticomyces elasticus]KAK5737872.1 hypothetical protein LTS12_025762 [Elasticomyces elasticus]
MDRSPLLTLSAELRNCIYELVLIQAAPITITECTHSDADDMILRSHSSVAHPTALLMTCKDIKAEASTMFYASHTFAFSCINVNVTGAFANKVAVAEAFLHQIGPHNRLGLRSIRFEASTFNSFEYSNVNSPFTKLSVLAEQNPQIKDFRCAAKLAMIAHRPNHILDMIIDVCNLVESTKNGGKVLQAWADDAPEPADEDEMWMTMNARVVAVRLRLLASKWAWRKHFRGLGLLDVEEEVGQDSGRLQLSTL